MIGIWFFGVVIFLPFLQIRLYIYSLGINWISFLGEIQISEGEFETRENALRNLRPVDVPQI